VQILKPERQVCLGEGVGEMQVSGHDRRGVPSIYRPQFAFGLFRLGRINNEWPVGTNCFLYAEIQSVAFRLRGRQVDLSFTDHLVKPIIKRILHNEHPVRRCIGFRPQVLKIVRTGNGRNRKDWPAHFSPFALDDAASRVADIKVQHELPRHSTIHRRKTHTARPEGQRSGTLYLEL
jgi:hypothetical protein